MPIVKYWHNWRKVLDTAKEKIPGKYRIGDTCFMSLTTIEGNLHTKYTKDLNHVPKEVNDLLSVIIVLGNDVHSGQIISIVNGITMNNIGKRAHVLRHSHGR